MCIFSNKFNKNAGGEQINELYKERKGSGIGRRGEEWWWWGVSGARTKAAL